MKLTFLSSSFFPFPVPEKDASFAASVGPRTVYPAGYSLARALQIYWRADDYQIEATASDIYAPITQDFSATGVIPPRNAAVTTNAFNELTGYAPVGPGDLVPGRGLRQIVRGTGTITVSGDAGSGSNPAALLNLRLNLFWPEILAPDPVVKYDGLWWPAMSLDCSTFNEVELDGDAGSLGASFDCTTLPIDGSTELIGSFSFFGVSLPVYSSPPAPAQTRSFSGSLSVGSEWP